MISDPLEKALERQNNKREGASWQMLRYEGVILMPDADPSNTYISVDTSIGKGTIIWPGAEIVGKTTIGENCVVLQGAKLDHVFALHRCTLGGQLTEVFVNNDTKTSNSSTITNSMLGEKVTIGDSIVENSTIGHEAEIGNFNVVRRSTVGMRTKVPYLTQLADVEIGNDTNIGKGGTISNFDGHRKKNTKIGNKCFIGTDVNINGGLTIGDEVRIYPKLFLEAGNLKKKHVPDHAWVRKNPYGHGLDILENRSFKTPGHWHWLLPTKQPIKNPGLMREILKKIGAAFSDKDKLVEFLEVKHKATKVSLLDLLRFESR